MRRKNAKMSTASTISSTTLASINIDEDGSNFKNYFFIIFSLSSTTTKSTFNRNNNNKWNKYNRYPFTNRG